VRINSREKLGQFEVKSTAQVLDERRDSQGCSQRNKSAFRNAQRELGSAGRRRVTHLTPLSFHALAVHPTNILFSPTLPPPGTNVQWTCQSRRGFPSLHWVESGKPAWRKNGATLRPRIQWRHRHYICRISRPNEMISWGRWGRGQYIPSQKSSKQL